MLKITSINVVVIVGFCLLSACSSRQLAYKLQGDGPTSLELYRNNGVASASLPDSINADMSRARSSVNEGIRYEDYTRTAGNEIDQLFPRLPNPRIVIYVFPHLSTSENAPVPGYSTAVNLYEKDEYALPHEVPRYSALPATVDKTL